MTTNNENTPITYPHKDGPVTVLGPEIFASTENPEPDTVISWRGENFTVQPSTEPTTEEGRNDG